jgi:hypothetical protein
VFSESAWALSSASCNCASPKPKEARFSLHKNDPRHGEGSAQQILTCGCGGLACLRNALRAQLTEFRRGYLGGSEWIMSDASVL